jgi:hypothetical protein
MELREERLRFKHDAANVDRYVDRIVEIMKGANADPVAYMAIDLAFRPFLQWVHSAQLQRADADMVRGSTLCLMSTMVTEIMSRMNSDIGGRHLSSKEWAQDFLIDLSIEISQDIYTLEKAKNSSPTRQ